MRCASERYMWRSISQHKRATSMDYGRLTLLQVTSFAKRSGATITVDGAPFRFGGANMCAFPLYLLRKLSASAALHTQRATRTLHPPEHSTRSHSDWLGLDENENGIHYPTKYRIDDAMITAVRPYHEHMARVATAYRLPHILLDLMHHLVLSC